MKKKRSGKSCPRLGVFTAWFYGHYQLELFSGIEDAARRHGAQILYFSGRSLHSPVPFESTHNTVYETAFNASLDGLIVLSLLANYCDDAALTAFLSRYKDMPIVTVNFRSSAGNAVFADNAPGFEALVRHLVEMHGYKKLAFVKGPERNPDAMERYAVYKSVLADNGIRLDPALVTEGYYTFRAGQEAVRVYLDERGLRPGRDMEAIVCANDAIALGVIDALSDRGFRVPSDIAVTGFDNMNESIFPKFPLTSVKQHLREIGSSAVDSLMDWKPEKDPLYFDTELVIRDSCGCVSSGERPGSGPDRGRERKSAGKPDPDANKKDLEFLYYEITRIIDNLKVFGEMADFADWMRSNFPVLGIHSAWLFLRSGIPSGVSTYSLLSGYDARQPGEEAPGEDIRENAIFDDIIGRNPGRSFCILSLSFKEEKYGLLVMEVNMATSLVYDTLGNHIASSIRNIRLGEEVNAVNRRLLQSNEQKTRFFINVAHETKTPLTLIRNYLELYMERHEPDEMLLVIKRNMDLLLGNMLDFLDAERLERGEAVYAHDALTDLAEGAASKCDLFREIARKKNISVTLHAEGRVAARIDPRALDRIFNNLLDNAVKYTQEGGRVDVEVRIEDGKAKLVISDNGPGLPPDTSEHLFEPYYLLSKKRGGQRGIGVGLSIVKKILDGAGAGITVDRNEEGGTSFTIVFAESGAAITEETPREKPAYEQPVQFVEESIKEKNITEDKRSLLVVDDNIQLLGLVQAAFAESYNVFFARNTAEALVKLRIIPRPDLIVSDVMMDGADGFELLSRLSEKEGCSDIPFIFLTALGGEKEKVKGLGLGAVDYIEKPFSMAALRAKVESIIALRGRQEKQDVERIRSRIDGLFAAKDRKAADSANSRFEHVCEKYGIAGREREIVRMLASGLVNKQIASYMGVSQRAVEYHITKIYKKTGVNNKYDLMDMLQG